MGRSLDSQFTMLIEQLDTHILPVTRILPLLDLTRLDEQATATEIEMLAAKAQQDSVAAICVFPRHLDWIPDLTSIHRATVVNFPGGNLAQDQVLQDIERAITDHKADEIDYVFAYPQYLSGQAPRALAWCAEAYQLCQDYGVFFKVILETGALNSLELIHKLSCAVIESGCHMLKTSTGKINMGASLPAAFAILTAIQDCQSQCGIKVSGGVKTLAQASSYVHLAEQVCNQAVDKTWFRIGASQIG